MMNKRLIYARLCTLALLLVAVASKKMAISSTRALKMMSIKKSSRLLGTNKDDDESSAISAVERGSTNSNKKKKKKGMFLGNKKKKLAKKKKKVMKMGKLGKKSSKQTKKSSRGRGSTDDTNNNGRVGAGSETTNTIVDNDEYQLALAPPAELNERLVVVEEDVFLGQAEDDNTAVYADIYYPQTSSNKLVPLVLMAPEAGISKDAYSIMAHKMVQRGFGMMVLEHLTTVPSVVGPSFNLVYPKDFNKAIEYASGSNNTVFADSNIFLLGHGFGGISALSYLGGVCSVEVCIPGGPITPGPIKVNELVRAAAAYGTSLVSSSVQLFPTPQQQPKVQQQPAAFLESTNNAYYSFCILNGEGDENNVLEIDGIPFMQGTMERLVPNWVVATLEDLDHFSIANHNEFVYLHEPRQDVISTRPRQEQIDSVVAALAYWFQKQLLVDEQHGFCSDLRLARADVIQCQEEFAYN